MRVIWSSVVIFVVALAVSVAAETNQTELAEATLILNAMPECGRTCLLNEIANSPCALTDIECSCNSQTITDRTTVCVLASCTVKNQLTTKNSTSTLCHHPFRDKRGPAQASVMAGLAISCLAYVLRIASKIHKKPSGIGFVTTLWWDDAVMGFALIEIVAITVSAVMLNRAGLGTDIWTIPFPNITWILKIYYWDEDLYLTALSAVKISLLLTYLRIFPAKNFRIACYTVIGLNVAYGIAFVLISVFQCWPIPMAWERWHGEYQGRCNDINAQGWASAALNLILDVLTLSLPLPSLWKMQLNKRKKFWVMLMFCVGFFVTIVSIIRLQVLIKFGNSQNLTWDYTAVGYWSTVELHASVVCASMPAIRNLLRKFAPKVMGNTSAQTPHPSAQGRSADRSGFRKSAGPEIQIRTIDSDEENFIPLDEIMANHSQPLPPVGR